jgi:hypothetical protein
MADPMTESGRSGRTIAVMVFAPSNAHHDFDARTNERADELARTAVRLFVEKGQMQPAECGLALIRDGIAIPLDDASRLNEDGVGNGSKLKLIVKKPKTDGAGQPR